jgi:hypothetical protein
MRQVPPQVKKAAPKVRAAKVAKVEIEEDDDIVVEDEVEDEDLDIEDDDEVEEDEEEEEEEEDEEDEEEEEDEEDEDDEDEVEDEEEEEEEEDEDETEDDDEDEEEEDETDDEEEDTQEEETDDGCGVMALIPTVVMGEVSYAQRATMCTGGTNHVSIEISVKVPFPISEPDAIDEAYDGAKGFVDEKLAEEINAVTAAKKKG